MLYSFSSEIESRTYNSMYNHENRKNYTLKEARKDPQLWFYMIILFYWALYNTAFTFHITSIFETLGKTKGDAVAIFLPIAVISVGARFLGSWLSDMIRMKNVEPALALLFALQLLFLVAIPWSL